MLCKKNHKTFYFFDSSSSLNTEPKLPCFWDLKDHRWFQHKANVQKLQVRWQKKSTIITTVCIHKPHTAQTTVDFVCPIPPALLPVKVHERCWSFCRNISIYDSLKEECWITSLRFVKRQMWCGSSWEQRQNRTVMLHSVLCITPAIEMEQIDHHCRTATTQKISFWNQKFKR